MENQKSGKIEASSFPSRNAPHNYLNCPEDNSAFQTDFPTPQERQPAPAEKAKAAEVEASEETKAAEVEVEASEDDEDMYEDIEEEENPYNFFGAERVLEELYREYLQERFDFVYRIDVTNMSETLGMMLDAVISNQQRGEQAFPVIEARTDNMHDTGITTKMAKFCATIADAAEIEEDELI